MKKYITPLLLLHFLLAGWSVVGQEVKLSADTLDPVRIAKDYISTHLADWGLISSDVSDMRISDKYTDTCSGIRRIYFQQQFEGIPVHNAILNVNLTQKGEVFYAASRFVKGLVEKINSTATALHPGDAIKRLASDLGLTATSVRMKESGNDTLFVFDKDAFAREDITAELSYQPVDTRVLLAWDILFSPTGTKDTWSARVDALNGQVLDKNNWTLYCQVDHESFIRDEDNTEESLQSVSDDCTMSLPTPVNTDDPTGAQYHVWPAPYDSPNQGPRALATNPADSIASPFGWHDINGQPGPEFTITRGNNVYAYQDRDNTGVSSGDEPDGGPNLIFDFPYDSLWEPEQYKEASVVNLFYWINYMHDFAYRFGFDEQAGNFQKHNYGRGGIANDFVWAVAQAGANGDTLHNNAAFVHRNDGTSPSIFMFDFIDRTRYVTVVEPAAVAGRYRTNIPSAGWGAGAYVTDVPVTGEVVLVDDGVEEPLTSDGCQEIRNASALVGKIAMIDRGACQFGYKALQAQHAGAIGVIFCNHIDNKTFTLAAGPDAASVNIPVVLLNLKESQTLRKFVGKGLKATLVNPGQIGPSRLDSDFQNSMIAHEFGHGISTRLAGGPNRTCLDNAEQMGEGWSDFFGLVVTAQPGDSGTTKRGVGNFVLKEQGTHKGIRRYPYSNDMNISPLTYADVASNQETHDLGEVWANVLWDMYWALSDAYGWSANPFDTSAGNYKAVRLIMDGLKNIACDPGFVDGRDAILAADASLYQGVNACLLWEVFARRGLGYSADQGSAYDAGDQVAAFDIPPACTGQITIEKWVTGIIQPGEDIHVTIKVGNHKNETVSNVVVRDLIPEGTSFQLNSSNYPVLKQGHELLFDLGNMIVAEENVITYTLHTSPNKWSMRKFVDEVPADSNVYWVSNTFGGTILNSWVLSDSFPAHSGEFTWFSAEIPEKSQQALALNPDMYAFHVEGDHPALRFYHRFQTQAGLNGGIVEVREVGTTSWNKVDQYMLRNGYTGTIDYRTFITADVKAFSGTRGDTFQATYVDLRPWMGKDIQIRFRFGTYDNLHQGSGWLIDDIEFMDLLAYNEEVCVTTDQGDFECTRSPEQGTIVESKEEIVSSAGQIISLITRIFPNPASDVLTIELAAKYVQDVHVRLLTLEGRILFSTSLDDLRNENLNINTSLLPPGFYMVSITTAEGQYVEKVVVRKS